MSAKKQLRALLKGLQIEHIDKMMEQKPEFFFEIGNSMVEAQRKLFKASNKILVENDKLKKQQEEER